MCTALGLAALSALLPAKAAFFDMPAGGTSWIEASSNACDLGTPANGADCFGAADFLPTRDYSLEPPATLTAGGSVRPDRIELQNIGTSSGGFAWGATGGLFTVVGSGTDLVTVTATLDVSGSLDKSVANLGLASLSWKIGTWAFDPVSSELNFRVNPIVSDGTSCSFSGCASADIDRALTHTFQVLPGQAFNLGFQLTTSTLTASTTASATAAAVALITLDAGPGFHVLGSNGYDSRVSPVPEPSTLALMGLGVAVLLRRRLR